MSKKNANNYIFHIFNKSIAGYTIFNSDKDYCRMVNGLMFFNNKTRQRSFSTTCVYTAVKEKQVNPLTKIIAYCIMPTHFHIIVEQILENGISNFMSNLCNSYSRYFNLKHNRRGPLWQGRFKSVHVSKDEQVLHLTRYIHLNPVTAGIVKKPEKWPFSSYIEYLGNVENKMCEYSHLLDIKAQEYAAFVNDRIHYQRELSKIRKMILE